MVLYTSPNVQQTKKLHRTKDPAYTIQLEKIVLVLFFQQPLINDEAIWIVQKLLKEADISYMAHIPKEDMTA